MSPGGSEAGLLELAVGFFAAASLVAVLTVLLRRRSGRQDLLGTQVREMQARAAASPAVDTRLRDAATGIADARRHETAPPEAPADTPQRDPTAPPAGWQTVPGGKDDAVTDAFAWLRIVALVEAGQREQAIELLATTMTIPAGEAEMLVDGLIDAGGEHRPD